MSNSTTILGMTFEYDKRPWISDKGEYYDDFWKKAWESGEFMEYFRQIKTQGFKWHVVKLLNLPVEEMPDGMRKYEDVELGRLNEGYSVVRRVLFTEDSLHLECRAGFFGIDIDSNVEISVSVNGEKFAVMQKDLNGLKVDKNWDRAVEFEFDYPLTKGMKKTAMQIMATVDGKKLHLKKFSFGKFSFLAGNLPGGYYASNGWVITSEKDFSTFYIEGCTPEQAAEYEKNFCRAIKKAKVKGAGRISMIRKLVSMLRKSKKKPICLVSDRVSKADDNGEAFFKYMTQNRADEFDTYFVIDGESADFKRLQQYGKVVPFFSWKHRLLHLKADSLVSSQVNDFFFNPFRGAQRYYKNLMDQYRFVFLQHGIISNDLSDWLRKQKKYLHGFVVTTQEEYDRVRYGDYDYTDEIWLTGLPRYDYLEDKSENIITLLPTWRMYLAKKQDPVTGYWILVDDFKNTTYATFFRNLLSDERLNEAAERLGYRIQFKLHPSFTGLEHEFELPEYANIVGDDISYREIYSKSKLVVSDYSSAIYDFLYLRKPIIYAQFDADEFFAGKHIYDKGDFDYEIQGFGEVEYDLDGTVNRIIEYMENDCQLKDKYRERIDSFFVFNDKNNCERIYNKMME